MNILRLNLTAAEAAVFKKHGLYNFLGVNPNYRSMSVVEKDLEVVIAVVQKLDGAGADLAAKCRRLLAGVRKQRKLLEPLKKGILK